MRIITSQIASGFFSELGGYVRPQLHGAAIWVERCVLRRSSVVWIVRGAPAQHRGKRFRIVVAISLRLQIGTHLTRLGNSVVPFPVL